MKILPRCLWRESSLFLEFRATFTVLEGARFFGMGLCQPAENVAPHVLLNHVWSASKYQWKQFHNATNHTWRSQALLNAYIIFFLGFSQRLDLGGVKVPCSNLPNIPWISNKATKVYFLFSLSLGSSPPQSYKTRHPATQRKAATKWFCSLWV